MNMLVTGGAGFIGSNFIRHVLQNNFVDLIVNLDKLTYAGSLSNLRNLSHTQKYHFVQGDIADAVLVRQILEDYQIDVIVHFAAESHVDRSIADPQVFVQTNVTGTFILLEEARRYCIDRFHHVSTDEVYGSLQLNDLPFTERTPYQPRSPYAATKAASDHLVRAYYSTYNLPVTISNCSNNYGSHQHREKLIPTIISSCLNWKSIPIYGNGKNIRDWLHVEDHCRGIMAIIEHGRVGESYNIGANCEIENISLAKYICEQMDFLCPCEKPYASLIQLVNDRLGHDFRYAIDSSKIRRELDWSAQETLTSGLRKTIEFYLNKDSVKRC